MNQFVAGTLLALAGVASSATAGITFSNVTIAGSLAGGATFVVNDHQIDFIFPAATVGDTTDPIRSGNIVIIYEAQVTGGQPAINEMIVAILGALSGSGQIFFNEVIEDLDNPGIVASYNANITSNNQLPFFDSIPFDRAVTNFKVKKTFLLDAIDTAAFDLANVSLVEQLLIPTPGTAMLLGIAAMPILRRRRG